MPKFIKIFLFLILFIIFFEAGVISSYTLVTSHPPDVEKLINIQIEALYSYIKMGQKVISPKPKIVDIDNKMEVARVLQQQSGVSGIELETLNVTTFDNLEEDVVNVNITARGYSENITETSGQIRITPTMIFEINAIAKAKPTISGVEVDVKTIKIVSILKIYKNGG